MLFNSSPYGRISIPLVIGLALGTGAFFAFAVASVIRARRRPTSTGGEGLIGQHATVRTRLDPDGTVFLMGELWNATSLSGPIEVGEDVVVIKREGFRLYVKHPSDGQQGGEA